MLQRCSVLFPLLGEDAEGQCAGLTEAKRAEEHFAKRLRTKRRIFGFACPLPRVGTHLFLALKIDTASFRGTNLVFIFETRLLDAHFGLPFKSLERAFCVLIENKR